MITIDEAIAINEYQMKNALEKLAVLNNASSVIEAKYYEQMVGWLKELKAYRACENIDTCIANTEKKLKDFENKKTEFADFMKDILKGDLK